MDETLFSDFKVLSLDFLNENEVSVTIEIGGDIETITSTYTLNDKILEIEELGIFKASDDFSTLGMCFDIKYFNFRSTSNGIIKILDFDVCSSLDINQNISDYLLKKNYTNLRQDTLGINFFDVVYKKI